MIKDRAKFRATIQAIVVLCIISALSKLLPASERVVDRWDLAIYDLSMKKLSKASDAKELSASIAPIPFSLKDSAATKVTDSIATIAITSEDLSYYSLQSRMGWPWRRALYNHIIGYCKKGDAKALMFDLLFTDYSAEGGDDSAFADGGLKTWDKVYLVGEFQATAPEQQYDENPELKKQYIQKFSIPVEHNDPKIKVRECKHIRFPINDFCDVTSNIVDTTEIPDFDGKLRRYILLSRYEGYYFPSAALRILWDAEGKPPIIIEDGYLRFGSHKIPVDENCSMNLKFYGPGNKIFKTYEARTVIQNNYIVENEPGSKPTYPANIFKDKIVLVGAYFPGMDVKKVPVDLTYPGVETHATALANIIGKDFLVELPRLWVIIWSIFYIPVSVFTFRYIKANLCKYALYGLIGIHVALVVVMFTQNVWVGAIPQISAILSCYITSIALNYVQEGKQRALVKKTFQSYVSPNIVNKILDKSGELSLLGERKKLTVMFTDFEGFTSLSEKMPPEELVALLKRYLTKISQQVFITEGVIDKFVGDAVIAFWGDPLPQSDHALRACRSAILIRKVMDDLRKEEQHPLYARIGINTGEVVVGNMGSENLFNYTVIGDEVNFTSRLEGANKEFGTRVLISESTYNDAKDKIITREVGLLRVKGKEKSIRVFELVGIKGEHELIPTEAVNSFNNALNLFKSADYAAANSAFASIVKQNPDDKLSLFYLNLCEKLKNSTDSKSEYVHELTSK